MASEFAIVRVRRSRIDQLISEGNRRAVLAKRIITDLDEYLSASQLGITLTSIGLGVLGEPAFERMLHPVFQGMGLPDSAEHVTAFAAAYGLITFYMSSSVSLRLKRLRFKSGKADVMDRRTASVILRVHVPVYLGAERLRENSDRF